MKRIDIKEVIIKIFSVALTNIFSNTCKFLSAICSETSFQKIFKIEVVSIKIIVEN